MVKLSAFIGIGMFLLMVINSTALDIQYMSLDENGEEIVDLSKYSDMGPSELTDEEVLIVRRSLCDVGIFICVFGLVCLLFILYTLLKKK